MLLLKEEIESGMHGIQVLDLYYSTFDRHAERDPARPAAVGLTAEPGDTAGAG